MELNPKLKLEMKLKLKLKLKKKRKLELKIKLKVKVTRNNVSWLFKIMYRKFRRPLHPLLLNQINNSSNKHILKHIKDPNQMTFLTIPINNSNNITEFNKPWRE